MSYEEKLIELALKNENIIILTAENRASIRNLPNVIKDQFIDTGISEQSLIGISAGLALRRRIPIVHAIAAFLTMRSFEFIRTDIGYPNFNVKLVGNFPGLLSEANGPTHQAIEDISLMRAIPGMNIFCPADKEELIKGMAKIVNYKRPFYIRYNDLPAEVEHSEFALGKAEVFGNGKDVAICVYGTLFNQAYKAKSLLEKRGFSTRLINLRTLRPLDSFEIINSLQSCNAIVTIEDHYKTGGLYTIISEIIAREKIKTDILSISLENRFFKPAKFNTVLEYEGFTGLQMADQISDYLNIKEQKFNVEWNSI